MIIFENLIIPTLRLQRFRRMPFQTTVQCRKINRDEQIVCDKSMNGFSLLQKKIPQRKWNKKLFF